MVKADAIDLEKDNGNYVDYGSGLDPAGDFTAEAWVKRETQTAWNGIFGNYSLTGNQGWFIQEWGTAGKIDASIRTSYGYRTCATAAGALPSGEWHHVALVFNKTGGKLKLYIDGTEAATVDIETDASVLASDKTYQSWFYRGNVKMGRRGSRVYSF